jgi:hypothetical protein
MPKNLRASWENIAFFACWVVFSIYGERFDKFPFKKELITLFVVGVLAQVYFFLRLRANAVAITTEQFPELHASVERCRARFGAKGVRAYIIHGNELWMFKGGAPGTKTFYLTPSTVDNALAVGDPRALDFFVGREMGSALLGHGGFFRGHFSRLALMFPPIEIWHRRCMARSRDRAGIWACGSIEVAERCFAVMAAGPKLGRTLDIEAAKRQWQTSRLNWMTLLSNLAAMTPHATERIATAESHGRSLGLPLGSTPPLIPLSNSEADAEETRIETMDNS